MSGQILVTLMPLALVALIFSGLPIYITFLICNLGAVALLMGSSGIGLFANSVTSTVTSGTLVAVPLFVLMGDILYRGNAVDALVRATDRLVGRIKGRHYVLSVVVSTILATLSGSQLASSAMLCRTVYPMLAKRSYDTSLSLGVIIGGACLAPIIPPSILAILISTIAQISVADLFIAGIVPGLLIAALMLGYIGLRVWLNPVLAPEADAGLDEVDGATLSLGAAILHLVPFAAVIGFVTVSLIFGIVTPTEAGAIGTVAAMGVAAIFQRLTPAMLAEAFRSTATVTATIMVIVVSSQLFSQLLAFSGTSQTLRSLVTGLEVHGMVMLAVMLLIPFVACMFLDEVAVMLILIPIYAPLLPLLGFDPVWFWTLFLLNMTLGGVTPPVGYVLFVMKGILDDVRLGRIFAASLPFVGIYILATAILAAFPGLVTALL